MPTSDMAIERAGVRAADESCRVPSRSNTASFFSASSVRPPTGVASI